MPDTQTVAGVKLDSTPLLADVSVDDLNGALLERSILRGAAAIARAEASLAGLRRNQDTRLREWSSLLIRRMRKANKVICVSADNQSVGSGGSGRS